MRTFDFYIQTKDDLIEAIDEFGFVPYFRNEIEGFSIEEHVERKKWFDGEEGVWEWKGPVIRESGCAYGKFFNKKAVFISRRFFADFACFRRGGMTFAERVSEGLVSYRERKVFEALSEYSPVISKDLKYYSGYGRNGKSGFDPIITSLQSACFALISDFSYEIDKSGKPYGWGVAEYSTPEGFFGEEFARVVSSTDPDEAYERTMTHLKTILPDAKLTDIEKILR